MQANGRITRHVIFLGAGASASSGYPIGNELRLQISSETHLKAALKKSIQNEDVISSCLNFYRQSKAIEIFREGCFGTVDEFSKLASRTYQRNLEEMKKLMQLAFSIHNPEDNFHESDYYSFIQRLFNDKSLSTLKPEVTVISYNYDCYLDFLLLRAYQQRQKLSGDKGDVGIFMKNKLTSGFAEPLDLSWATQTANFNYFKLHGSITYGSRSHHHLKFENDAKYRLVEFAKEGFKEMATPPIIFPWELFNRGRFISNEDFTDNYVRSEKKRAAQLYLLYKEIWTAAQEKIERANKISFVGLSMHDYLKDGLAFLFQKPPTAVSVVVANPENEYHRSEKSRLHPASLCGKVVTMLNQIAPDMKICRSQSEHDGNFSMEGFDGPYVPDITPRYSFKEFIQREMDQ
ncbi:MAG TPA: hypothetical protein VGO57_04375 [Verrucomicrobiae bacterium]|jgi:hypothetical protein